MIDTRVAICGVARDCADRLPYSLRIMEKIAGMFESAKFVFAEDTSIDNTLGILFEFSKDKQATLSNGDTRSERWINWQGGTPYRPEQIARARNIVLGNIPKDVDYVLMMDMDFVLEPDYDGIAECFTRDDWDAVFANGIAPDGCYWDWFALRDKTFPFGVETMGDAWYPLKRPHHFLTDEWHPVYSAFGGFGIYRREALEGCRYSAMVTPAVRALNTSLGFTGAYQTHQGVGPEPSLCEHVGLHADMIARGHGRLYINPRMVFRYSGAING